MTEVIHPRQRRMLYAAVFMSGMTILALELSASRLLGAWFGASNLVWSSIIGLILVYLAIGYFIGGWWADRSPHFHTFYKILVWASFLAGSIPFAADLILPRIASAGFSLGLATSAALFGLFTVPAVLLGCASPFAIRLALPTVEQTGRTAGQIYAIGTVGSVIGGLAPVLFLLPSAGTTATILLFTFALAATGLLGLMQSSVRSAAWHAALPLILVVLMIAG